MVSFQVYTYSSVDSITFASSQAHIGNCTIRTIAGLLVVGSIIDSRNDTRETATAAAVQHLDSVQLGFLGNAIRHGANRAGNMRAMPIAVTVYSISNKVG
jgi:hypothetical protein